MPENDNAPGGSQGQNKENENRNCSSDNAKNSAKNQAKLCSGFGQFHSPHNKVKPQAFLEVTLGVIEAMAQDPPAREKSKAQWVIPSSLLSRCHQEQRKNGKFYALWADIDETSSTFIETISQALCVIPDLISYTTKSATPIKQKCRIIVPLKIPLPGHLYVIAQKILNDKLEAVGIIPDRVSERPGQVCYLPNRGEFYQFHVDKDLGPLDIRDWYPEIREERKRKLEADRQLQERRTQARLKAQQRIDAGCLSPIQAFNEAYDLELVLESFGYIRKGSRWLSPLSSTGVPGVTVMDSKWFSSHGSDAGIGRPTQTGCCGDAFDLFVFFQHGGDRMAAIRAAGDMFQVNGKSISKNNQVKYMESANG
jgi:hypothetical protein